LSTPSNPVIIFRERGTDVFDRQAALLRFQRARQL
jgi:hypothetical protein